MRKLIRPSDLLERLNDRLAADEVPAGCRFVGPVHRLRVPDPDGCNWGPFLVLVGSGLSPVAYRSSAEQALLAVSREYNLAAGPNGGDHEGEVEERSRCVVSVHIHPRGAASTTSRETTIPALVG